MEERGMADDSRKLSITYSSGLIPPPELMSTLAVFYDEIWLPNAYFFDIESLDVEDDIEYDEIVAWLSDEKIQALEVCQRAFNRLKVKWSALYYNNILKTLPAHESVYLENIQEENFDLTSFLGNTMIRSAKQFIKEIEPTIDNKWDAFSDGLILSIFTPLLLLHHLSNDNNPIPKIFLDDTHRMGTQQLSTLLTQRLFQYRVSQLRVLNAEQILEVREYLKDSKEGFAYYINEMTDDVERRIREHNLSGIEASQKTFERKIQPQYEEFRRQLAAKKTGFWSKVAVAGGKFLQVDAAPWTPKFWGAVLEMCGVSLDELSKSEQENFLSNKSQAFNYIATLEEEISKRSP
jgi:hypothetical protein